MERMKAKILIRNEMDSTETFLKTFMTQEGCKLASKLLQV